MPVRTRPTPAAPAAPRHRPSATPRRRRAHPVPAYDRPRRGSRAHRHAPRRDGRATGRGRPSRPAPPIGGRVPPPGSGESRSPARSIRRSCAATGPTTGGRATAPALGVSRVAALPAAGPSGWPGGWCAWVRSGSVEDTYLRIHRGAGQTDRRRDVGLVTMSPVRESGRRGCRRTDVHGATHPPPPRPGQLPQPVAAPRQAAPFELRQGGADPVRRQAGLPRQPPRVACPAAGRASCTSAAARPSPSVRRAG